MILRPLAYSFAVVALSASAASAQEVADLAALARRSQEAADPAASFLRGLAQLEDGEVDAAALEAARSGATGPVADLLQGVTSIRKVGGLITIERAEPAEVALGEGKLQLERTVRLAVDEGEVERLRAADRERLGAEAGSFTRVRGIAGISLDGKPLRALVTVDQAGSPVTHAARGTPSETEWQRVGAPAPVSASGPQEASAPAPQGEAVAATPRDGLVDRIGEVTGAADGAQAPAQEPTAAAPSDDGSAAGQSPAAEAPSAEAVAQDSGAVGPEGEEIVVPPAEEKERVDAAVDALKSDMDELATRIDELKQRWDEDRAAGQRDIEALIAELRRENEALEAELARVRRGEPVDGPRGTPVAGPDLNGSRPVSGPAPGEAQPLRRDGEAPAETTAVTAEKEKSPLERLFMMLLEGITKGLQERLSGEAARNLENKGEAVAITTDPAHRPYVDQRLSENLGSSGLVNGLPLRAALNTPRVLRFVPGQPISAGVAPAGTMGPVAPTAPAAPTAGPSLGGSPPSGAVRINTPLGMGASPLGRN